MRVGHRLATFGRAIDANMLTPVFLIRAVVAGMVARGFGRIINITTMGVKSPRDLCATSGPDSCYHMISREPNVRRRPAKGLARTNCYQIWNLT